MHEGYDSFKQMALSLPGMIESTSYGTPSIKMRNKFIARLHEDGLSMVLTMDFEVLSNRKSSREVRLRKINNQKEGL